MKLHISEDLTLPVDAVTQKLAFLGRTGSGKTYAAQKLAEEMLRVQAQVVCLDPVGVWYGLRISGDGKSPGLPITIFGGLHGDLPLEPTGGALIANLLVDRGISAVIDVSQFESDAAKNRFASDLAERLFFRKKAAPSAMMVFIEECQEFIPENPGRNETMMLHYFTRMVKIGRNFGIGLGMISQRPQEVNKKCLNLTECMFAFQMTGPHERKTIKAWVEEKGGELDIVDLLPRLEVGQAHLWSPQWLKVSQTIRIGQKWTYNASSTPTFGAAKRIEPKPLESADMERIRQEMADTIERAKADDPRELRLKISELERKLKAVPKPAAPAAPAKRVDVPVLKEGHLKRLEVAAEKLDRAIMAVMAAARLVEDGLKKLSAPAAPVVPVPRPETKPYAADQDGPYPHKEHLRPSPKRATVPASTNGHSHATGGLRRMLVALAQRNGLNARQLGVRAGMSSGSGTFSTYLAKGRTEGWIEGSRDRITITRQGVDVLGSYEPLPEGRDLLNYWMGELTGGARNMLAALADNPKGLSAEQLGEAAGLSSGSGTFSTYLSKLRTLELISGSRDHLKASEELF